MFAVVTPETIQLPAGAVLRLPATWQDSQALSQQLGDRSILRIKYRPGEILLMSSLPDHEQNTSSAIWSLRQKLVTGPEAG